MSALSGPGERAQADRQLSAIGVTGLGSALNATIDAEPSLEDLQRYADILVDAAHIDVHA